ncbi:MAG: Rne/Rng family ribonuclease [Alphaproteobacteria bacterium]|nr:Rne/Rng family ribonuclease [Alphaproteobacteria bacterium]
MPKRMLIDASHPEETRVVVLDGQKVEEFDFEAASKRPLKGNIYLAKVTRVEPSLQAAFVEYGGNRQGFLAFSEIHPDYYQIPVADRLALLAEQEADARRRQEDDIESFEITSSPKKAAPDMTDHDESAGDSGHDNAEGAEGTEEDTEEAATSDRTPAHDEGGAEYAGASETTEPAETLHENGTEDAAGPGEQQADDNEPDEGEPELADQSGEPAGRDEPAEGASPDEGPAADAGGQSQALQAKRPSQRWMRRRHYKIQEVIKRRQIILVQVVKEERGNKGAALTTYLSLAGRYCVLMPNTPRGGGISRKITNATDRKRLKSAAQSLELPEGMGLIIRTAGENRTKVEIKRDYEYLLRLWDTIRDLTLKSNAPACVYEEGDLIKRAIRDLYNKDVSEVVVEGEEGYRNAKDFMRMLMPSHAKNVKVFKEPVPLFQRHHIEAQLDAMFSPTVTLKSGGYIVINQTEALVSIDVNSGRATREHSIEDTATKTNLEAADEIGRQLRLRDLAGLIVIDFIDMEDSRNDRSVEKRLHNAVKNDRARVQIGKISQFGLLEMSRQRLRAGVIAGSTVPCPHCGGQGIVRSVESTSLRVLRGLEEEAQKQRAEGLTVLVAEDVAFYTLNQKRRELARLESEYDITISFEPKEGLKAGDFEIERIGQREPSARAKSAVTPELPAAVESEPEDVVEEVDAEPQETISEEIVSDRPQQPAGEGGGRRRRRRRRRGGRDRSFQGDQPRDFQPRAQAGGPAPQAEPDHDVPEGEAAASVERAEAPYPSNGQPDQSGQFGEGRRRKRRRRRGRRGGRDRNHFGEQRPEGTGEVEAIQGAAAENVPLHHEAPFEDRFGRVDEIDTTPREEPRPVPRPDPRPADSEAVPNAASTPVWSLEAEAQEERASAAQKPDAAAKPQKPDEPPKKGWWQRTFRPD